MLDTTFVLTPAERGELLQPPPQGNIDQQPQIDEQPQPQAAHPPWLPLVVPDAVPGAHRDDPKFVLRPNEHQFLGGRWLDSARQRCKMCPSRRNWSGRGRCESPACGHRPICNFHSVILCQIVFIPNSSSPMYKYIAVYFCKYLLLLFICICILYFICIQ